MKGTKYETPAPGTADRAGRMGRIMRRRHPCLALALLLLAGSAAAGAAETPAGGEKAASTVLLLTSPRRGELENLARLVERGWLSVAGLRVIGIHHRDEYTDYGAARRWLEQEGPDWMRLRELDCALDPERVFQRNGCSQSFAALFAESDGLLLTGGPDIPPALYGRPTRPVSSISDPPRHRFEIALLVQLLVGDEKADRAPLLAKRPRYLVLGICLGMQTLNVALGGTLHQDIPTRVYGLDSLEAYAKLPAARRHRSVAAQLDPASGVGWGQLHPIALRDHRLVRELVAARRPVTVLSLHHQALAELGAGLEVWASSPDGKVIEGVAHQRYPHVLGVQFHPEKRVLYDPERTYRRAPGAEPKNFAAAHLSTDPRARRFHHNFWKLISALLARSAAAGG